MDIWGLFTTHCMGKIGMNNSSYDVIDIRGDVKIIHSPPQWDPNTSTTTMQLSKIEFYCRYDLSGDVLGEYRLSRLQLFNAASGLSGLKLNYGG